MNRLSQILFVISLFLLGIGIYTYQKGIKKEESLANDQYFQKKDFKPDTIRLKVPYAVPKPYGIYVPPKIVYLHDILLTPGITIKCDSLISVIDSLHGMITKINPTFLKFKSEREKLIAGYFSKDTLKLDLLKVDGNLVSTLYMVDYNRYRYLITEGSLSTIAIPYHEKTKVHSNLYLTAGYQALQKYAITSLDYRLQVSRVIFEAEAKSSIQEIPHFELNAKIGYQLFK